MKGYLTFLLVLAALAILSVLGTSYLNSDSMNLGDAISLEHAEQLSLEAKRSMLSAAKYGAISGFFAYVSEVLASRGAKAFDPAEAEERAKDGAQAALLLVKAGDEDYEALLWCGEIASESELGKIAEDSLTSRSPQMCALCRPISSCGDYLNIEMLWDLNAGEFALSRVELGSISLGETPKIFGATLYSSKFNVSKVAYVPTGENALGSPAYFPQK